MTIMHSGDGHPMMVNGTKAVVITPSDTVDLTSRPAILYVGGTGHLRVDTVGGSSDILFSNVPVGWFDKVLVTRVRATGTTATLIVAVSAT